MTTQICFAGDEIGCVVMMSLCSESERQRPARRGAQGVLRVDRGHADARRQTAVCVCV
jgi:hypothetical protein